MLIKTLVSLEGSKHLPRTTVAPGSIFDADDELAERLLDMDVAMKPSKEDIAIAKTRGTYIEAETPRQTRAARTEKPVKAEPAPAPTPADSATEGAADDGPL